MDGREQKFTVDVFYLNERAVEGGVIFWHKNCGDLQ